MATSAPGRPMSSCASAMMLAMFTIASIFLFVISTEKIPSGCTGPL